MKLPLITISILLMPAGAIAQQAAVSAANPSILQSDPSDPEQQIQRTARGKMFNFSGRPLPLLATDTSDYQLLTTITMRSLPELPIGESDAIVIGDITDSSVFVSDNKKALYTDYTFTVTDILKPSGGGRPNPGLIISIVRLGGTARRQTAGVIGHRVVGYGPEPATGFKYLMFLKHTPAPADTYAIVKFWHIQNGVIKAAFEQDKSRASEQQSTVHGRTVGEVIALIEKAVK